MGAIDWRRPIAAGCSTPCAVCRARSGCCTRTLPSSASRSDACGTWPWNPLLNVEKHGRRRGAWLEHLDDSDLLFDEEPLRAVSRVADEDGAREATRDDGRQLNGGEQRMWKEKKRAVEFFR
jgi:hypothetical protein